MVELNQAFHTFYLAVALFRVFHFVMDFGGLRAVSFAYGDLLGTAHHVVSCNSVLWERNTYGS